MKIERQMSDDIILEELGRRIVRRRLDFGFTQAELAEEAGISKRTVERIESGASAQVSTLIRLLRVLDLVDGLNALIQEADIRPMEMLKLKGASRKRASSSRKKATSGKWHWGDDS